MEKLCIVKRRSRPIQQGEDSTATIVSEEQEAIQEQDVRELAQDALRGNP